MLYCENCSYLYNIKKNIAGEEGIGFLFCENCGFTKKLHDNSLIFQTKNTVNNRDLDIQSIKHDIYQRKIIEKCKNSSCPSKKSPVEVVIYRDNNFNVFYICTKCDEKIETI